MTIRQLNKIYTSAKIIQMAVKGF